MMYTLPLPVDVYVLLYKADEYISKFGKLN